MKTKIVLIPGTWAKASSWGSFIKDLEDLGLEVYTPEKTYHDLSYEEIEARIGNLPMETYVKDFIAYIKKLEGPIILLGHSLGGLIAQLLAESLDLEGMVLLGPAPSAEIFAFYPTMVHAFYKHFLRWGFWKKPLIPNKYAYFNYIANKQTDDVKAKGFAGLVPESGRVYTQMSLPFLDKSKSTRLDRSKIKIPVLVISGSQDKIVVPQISKKTSQAFRDSKFILIEDSDHLYTSQRVRKEVIGEIKTWLDENSLI